MPAAARTQRLVLHVAEHAASRWLPCESLAICDMDHGCAIEERLAENMRRGLHAAEQSSPALRHRDQRARRCCADGRRGRRGGAGALHAGHRVVQGHADAPGCAAGRALSARACPRSQQGVELFWCHICALYYPSRLHEQHHIVSANPVKDKFVHRSGAVVLPGLCCTSM